jgi:hypothetical protein
MPKVPINKYAAEWNPVNNQGKLLIQIGTGNAVPVPVDNAEEFTILLLMLSKTGVQFDNVTKEIEISPRPVGT